MEEQQFTTEDTEGTEKRFLIFLLLCGDMKNQDFRAFAAWWFRKLPLKLLSALW